MIPRPEIYLQYGFPQFSPSNVDNNIANPSYDTSAENSERNTNTDLACELHQHSTVPTQTDNQQNTDVITEIPLTNQDFLQTVTDTESEYPNTQYPSEIPNDIHKRVRKSIFDYSQTQNSLLKPTPRPRRRYDDEGKWKIIRQDENKKETNYEYL